MLVCVNACDLGSVIVATLFVLGKHTSAGEHYLGAMLK
jgi:hypothetical protein